MQSELKNVGVRIRTALSSATTWRQLIVQQASSDKMTKPPDPSEPLLTLVLSLTLSVIAYKLTSTLVPLLGPDLVAKGLGGKDMLKAGFKRKEDCKDGEQGGVTL